MRIGIVSDTHNNLPNVQRIVELFNAAGVSKVVHTGDITQPKTLDCLAGLQMPLYAVYGNNDEGEREALATAAQRHNFVLTDPPLWLDWASRRILVVHDPCDLKQIPDIDAGDIILHGHTHRLRIEQQGTGLIFNPGECAGMVPGGNSIGVLDLTSLQPQIINF